MNNEHDPSQEHDDDRPAEPLAEISEAELAEQAKARHIASLTDELDGVLKALHAADPQAMINALHMLLNDIHVEHLIRKLIGQQVTYIRSVTNNDYWGEITLQHYGTGPAKWSVRLRTDANTDTYSKGEVLHKAVSAALRAREDQLGNKLPALLTHDR